MQHESRALCCQSPVANCQWQVGGRRWGTETANVYLTADL